MIPHSWASANAKHNGESQWAAFKDDESKPEGARFLKAALETEYYNNDFKAAATASAFAAASAQHKLGRRAASCTHCIRYVYLARVCAANKAPSYTKARILVDSDGDPTTPATPYGAIFTPKCVSHTIQFGLCILRKSAPPNMQPTYTRAQILVESGGTPTAPATPYEAISN